jgi:signal transduction histidine kinase
MIKESADTIHDEYEGVAKNSEVQAMLERYKFGAHMTQAVNEKTSRVKNIQSSPVVIESLFNAIGRGVIFMNGDGIVTYMNRAAEEMLHADKKSIIGKKVYMLPLRTPVYRVLSENCRDAPVEIALLGRVYAVRAAEVKNPQGVVLGDMTEIWDISEEKKEKRQWEEFVAMMTHDLKSPLTVITGYLQMMKMGVYGEFSEKLDSVIDQMGQSGSKLLSMIEELLGTYQMEVGNITLKRESCNIEAVLNGCYRENLNEARDKNIEFSFSTDDGLPMAHLDCKQISRVFNNLISNAIKFTPRGGKVSVSASVATGNLYVNIEDTGIGIPCQDLSRIFNKYYRSAGASGFKGSGLGLAISRAIVEGHGGAIEVESREGKGSKFTVMIALSDQDGDYLT